MTPFAAFKSIWQRCDEMRALYTYLAGNLTAALKPDELLRAEYVARVSALDLYVHETVAQKMLETFERKRVQANGFRTFEVSAEALLRIVSAATDGEASGAFDLHTRRQLARSTYQHPEKIADGVRLISDAELWNEIALHQGATITTKIAQAKALKQQLAAIVERRNRIAHEGDLQPNIPREPRPIALNDLEVITVFIEGIVLSMDAIL